MTKRSPIATTLRVGLSGSFVASYYYLRAAMHRVSATASTRNSRSIPMLCTGPLARWLATLHPLDHCLPEPGGRDLLSALHQPREVVGHNLVGDRLLQALDDQRGGFLPAHVHEHHLGRQDLRPRVDVILARVLRRGPVRRLEHRHRVRHIGARRDADTADLRG